MAKYEVKLTENEVLQLRQQVMQPGFDVVFKFLQVEAFHAQAVAMECTDPDAQKRLMALTDAQAMSKAVSSLTARLNGYRELPVPQSQELEQDDPLNFSMFSERTTH